jgi:H3 lysine-79-specific histone-lysine N-methyltransferase
VLTLCRLCIGFSKEVYGETGKPIINEIIKRAPIKKEHTFLDLGSGIGNVLLQVACQTGCKAYGIELLDTPYQYAKRQLGEYKARMQMYGRSPGTVHVRKGDFLEDPKVHKVIERADVIFVNNYAFGSDVNHRLMHYFLSMREGATIISFVAFRPLDYKITDHNMNDIASILTVSRIAYGPGSVSWTASPGEYFIHTIDRKPLSKYMEDRSASSTGRNRQVSRRS